MPPVLWILLATLPFAAIYVAHFLSPVGGPTGFIQGDMPYYAANGREIFERGNGFAYPNPYDPDPNAPVIYFHWLLWILGFLTAPLGLDPGFVFVAWGAAFALLLSTVTWYLVRQVLPTPDLRDLLFLLTMWGGGLLCYGAIGASLLGGEPLGDILRFDPGNGWWFLNWGRNLTFPTESTYHLLVGGCWLLVLRDRQWPALAVAALLAATHPWSGLEILVTLAAFHGLRLVVSDRSAALPLVAATGVALAGFLVYNLVYLEAFESHRALRRTWQIDWSLGASSMLLAWSPVALLAAIRIASDLRTRAEEPPGRSGASGSWASVRRWLRRNEAVLVVAAGVAFLLSIHDRFVTPTQPVHFARGYVWMPLTLLGLPVLQRGLVALRGRWSPRAFSAGIVLLVLVAGFDNLVFVTSKIHFQQQPIALYFLTSDERDLFERIRDEELSGVAVARDRRVGYLLATYTALTPYAGHGYNTPGFTERIGHIERLFDADEPRAIPWLNEVRYALVADEETSRLSPAALRAWRPVLHAGDLSLYEVVAPADTRRP